MFRSSSKSGSWRPILEGQLAVRCHRVVNDILKELLRPCHNPKHIGLAGGKAGMAIFFDYLGRSRKDESLMGCARKFLEEGADALQEGAHNPSFYSGFTGLAWAYQHIHGHLEEDSLSEIDLSLCEFLDQTPWRGDYDLISGLVGIGVYGLERLPAPSATLLLNRVLKKLEETLNVRPEGFTWHTRPELLPRWQREINPDGYYNLGLAHGIPGVVALLGLLHEAGIQPERSYHLLDGAVRWLIAQTNPKGSMFCFRTVVPAGRAVGDVSLDSRIAWCYGDLGVAVSLLLAARTVNNLAWERNALDIARLAASHPLETSGDRDGGICHGAAGNAHLFNRIYQGTGEPVFKEAALIWFERLLQYQRAGNGIAGFSSYQPPQEGEERTDPWKPEIGLLEGIAGIAICLQAGLGGPAPDWDLFLLSRIPVMQEELEAPNNETAWSRD